MQFNLLFELSSRKKVAIAIIWDCVALLVAYVFSFWIRLGIVSWNFSYIDAATIVMNVALTLTLLSLFGHYKQMIRYIGLKAHLISLMVLGVSALFLFVPKVLFEVMIPVSVPIIYWAIASSLVIAPRFLIQASAQFQNYKMREKCLIFGAAEAGRSLAKTLNVGNSLQPIAFIDDKKQYHKKQILGLKVGTRKDIPYYIKRYGISKMLIAVHNASTDRRKELIVELEPYGIEILSIPNIQDLLMGRSKIDELREVHIEELLGREPVPPISELLDINIRGKSVLVTGAGGSIGSELCRQIVKSDPSKLVLFELSEFNLYQIEHELKQYYFDIPIVSILSSVQDTEVLRTVMHKHEIQTIYHAAAYKHVPMVESNPLVGIRNNVFGTSNVALVAAEYDVEKFVLISTDKAVRPTNIMGATKRFAELYIQGIAELGTVTKFSIVRFGNVLGSSGSVVPLFTKQIKAGGPVTVTHPEITRFFMTIPEAAELVIQAGAMGSKGEVFVLDMGDSVKIVDLARKMTHLMGHSLRTPDNPQGDIELKFSGLRPGEKLYEELLIDDADTTTAHPRILGADESKLPFEDVILLFDELNRLLLAHDVDGAKSLLRKAPLDYSPSPSQVSI